MARLLIIDDEPSLCEALAMALDDLFEVTTASTGRTGLACLAHEAVSMVLLDLHLPDLDGYTILQQIRVQQPRLPVVVLTGDPALATQAQHYGATDVVIKPWDLDILRVRLWQTFMDSR
ncbi:MAG: response regulator [Candidatus Tectomicrobia bacterium]|uniref:Response regulator n=1 Tax=Tectimicrobiota bacterium TaxID=2528274 RepID=A0A938B2S9_UNCTE|nr:response regulator [Candidatus Tectomicrobia bacterium]